MKKRMLSILCVLALCLGLLPVTALAADPTPPSELIVGNVTVVGTDDEGTDIGTGVGYYTYDNTESKWEKCTATGEESTPDVPYFHYDGNGTLTLKDAAINGTSSTTVGAGIYADGDLTIVLEGSSTVTGAVDGNGESNSIRVRQNLTIQGDGSLTAQGANTSEGGSYGIYVIGSFTQQSGSVTASGGNVNGTKNSTGLYVFGSTVTVEGGTLTATGDDASGNSYGICATGTVTVGSAAVTATGAAGYASYGLYIESSSPSVTLSDNGSLTARSGSATSEAVGIFSRII